MEGESRNNVGRSEVVAHGSGPPLTSVSTADGSLEKAGPDRGDDLGGRLRDGGRLCRRRRKGKGGDSVGRGIGSLELADMLMDLACASAIYSAY